MQTGSTRSCHLCDASDPELSHNASLLTDFHRNEENTWWQSQSMFYGIQHPNSVNLTLHLGKSTAAHLLFGLFPTGEESKRTDTYTQSSFKVSHFFPPIMLCLMCFCVIKVSKLFICCVQELIFFFFLRWDFSVTLVSFSLNFFFSPLHCKMHFHKLHKNMPRTGRQLMGKSLIQSSCKPYSTYSCAALSEIGAVLMKNTLAQTWLKLGASISARPRGYSVSDDLVGFKVDEKNTQLLPT